ncbi:MAG TPA: hypothetical protein VKP69_14460, partial [Isosphaeraceae bacterium]|nr:hypothetical protein [Isosphaeraceae bacterium]
RKGVNYRRKIRVEWREPKLLILYLSDRKGRMLRGTRPWIDGTMNGPDHLISTLAVGRLSCSTLTVSIVSC